MADMRTEYADLERRLDDEIRHQKSQRTIWIVVGVVLVVLLLIYFTVMSSKTAQAMEPEGVAGYAGEQLRERMPEIRKDLSESIRTQAPEMTDALIDRLVTETIPQGRERLEVAAKEHADAAVQEAEERLLQELDTYLENNSDQIQTMITQLSTPEGKEQLEEQLYQGLKQILEDPDLQRGLQQGHETLNYATGVLEYLSNPENELTDQEATTRDLIAILIEIGNRVEMPENMPRPAGKKIAPVQTE